MNQEPIILKVSPENKKLRLDQFLKNNLSNFSRSQIQKWIKKGHILCNGSTVSPSHTLNGQETISVTIPEEEISILPENIPLTTIYEDQFIFVINKPAGMVTHPAKGNFRGTLANAAAYHLLKKNDPPPLQKQKNAKKNVPTQEEKKDQLNLRCGIIHRLDKDTSGVLVIAKNSSAMQGLLDQFREREVLKVYRTIVCGKMKTKRGEIQGSIGKDFRSKKMTISSAGRFAQTDFKVLKSVHNYTYLEVYPKTGRTHQIRVHLSKIGFPVLGDKMYCSEPVPNVETLSFDVPRQMLHAYQIEIRHPNTKKQMRFTAPLPDDFIQILKKLELSL